MKKYLNKKVVIVLIIALCIAMFAAVTVTLSDNASGRIENVINTLTSPVKRGMAAMVDSLEQLYGYLYKYDLLEQENLELKEKIAQLENDDREYDKIEEENKQLRDLLELGERNEDYEFESASVLSWSASNFNSGFTISKGENAGFELNDCVITGSGYLVGRITEVNATSAIVTTVIDPNTNIGANIYEISELAVAQGDFKLMKSGQLKLSYLDASTQIVSGYTITTSGRSGLYPRGLVIGTVDEVVMDDVSFDNYAVITPSADLDQLSQVYVITEFGS